MRTDQTSNLLYKEDSLIFIPFTVTYFCLNYQDKTIYICTQHIPVLIHNPEQLVGLLDDADKLQGG